jgi:hypothetical protein
MQTADGLSSIHLMQPGYLAVLALPAIYLPTRTNLKLPKWFFYLFYPLHLAAIYAARLMIARGM